MVSTPLADPSGTIIPPDAHGAGLRRPTGRAANAPSLAVAARRPRTVQLPARFVAAEPKPGLHSLLARILGKTRTATGAETCALLQRDRLDGQWEPCIVSGKALAFPLAPAAINPLPNAQPVRIDIADGCLTGCIRPIPHFGVLLLSWRRHEAEPDLGAIELAARLVVAAIDQDRAGALDLSAWRCVDTALSATSNAVIARDASGRLIHISAPARALLGVGACREAIQEPEFLRELDLRDQWGQRITPDMLPSARLRAGKPVPDLVVSARHPRAGRQWLLLHAEAVRDGHGRVSVVLTTLRDFTIVQRFGETHWLRTRVAEHLHRRPIDLASIEHDIAAFLDGTCSIELAGESARPRRYGPVIPSPNAMWPDPDDGATELRLACGHLHRSGPAAPISADRAAAPQSPHVVDIPIEGDGDIYGHMICHREPFRPCFDQEELELLTELAEQVGLALAVSRLRASLHAGERMLVDIGQRLQDAEEAERRRMALSIHDGLAQVAASVCQQLEIIAHRFEPSCDDENRELQRARDLARRTVQEARMLIAGLRPLTLEAHGLGAAVREEIEALRCAGWTVRYMDGLGGARFDADLELDIYRVVQEALSNARKHAGPAPIEVLLEQRGAALHLEVRDHGAGFEPSATDPAGAAGSHVGLGGMRERIARMGGTLRVESAPGHGTRVKGDVPI